MTASNAIEAKASAMQNHGLMSSINHFVAYDAADVGYLCLR